MSVNVSVDLDLRPHENRDDFNHFMEVGGWKKFPDVATLWHRTFDTEAVDVARNDAIESVRHAARQAKITFEGAIIAGDLPRGFNLNDADMNAGGEMSAELVDYVMGGRWPHR
jgi:hypothetical protein